MAVDRVQSQGLLAAHKSWIVTVPYALDIVRPAARRCPEGGTHFKV